MESRKKGCKMKECTAPCIPPTMAKFQKVHWIRAIEGIPMEYHLYRFGVARHGAGGADIGQRMAKKSNSIFLPAKH